MGPRVINLLLNTIILWYIIGGCVIHLNPHYKLQNSKTHIMNLNLNFKNQIKSQRNKITSFPPNGTTMELVPATEPPLHTAGGKNHVVRKDYLEVKIMMTKITSFSISIKSKIWV